MNIQGIKLVLDGRSLGREWADLRECDFLEEVDKNFTTIVRSNV